MWSHNTGVGTRPDVAGIYTALAQVHPEQAKAYRARAAATRAGSNMQRGRPWVPRAAPRARKGPCCDHRGRYGHRGSGGVFERCPTREEAA